MTRNHWRVPVKLRFKARSLTAVLILGPILSAAALAQQPAVPDAPTPQAPPKLSGAEGSPITPGLGAGNEQAGPNSSSTAPSQDQAPPSSQAPATHAPEHFE